MLARFTLIDYDREMALVAVVKRAQARPPTARSIETERIVGVSRYITNPDQATCEFSLVVADDFSGKGHRLAADGKHHRGGARKGAVRDRRAGAGQQRGHAQADEEAGLLVEGLSKTTRTSSWCTTHSEQVESGAAEAQRGRRYAA